MTNIIEVRIRATDDTKATYDAVKAKAMEEGAAAGAAYSSAYQRAAQDYEAKSPARVTSARRVNLGPTPEEIEEQKQQIAALKQAMQDAGADVGEELTDSISDKVGEELGPKISDPVKTSGKQAGAAFGSAFQGDLENSLSGSALAGIGRNGGEQFSVSFGQGAKDSLQQSTVAAMVKPLEDEIPKAVAPDSPAGQQFRENAKQTGQQAGKDMGGGMSPLIATAIGGAAAVGAPLLLAGMGVAFAGVTALALKSNLVVKNDFAQLGKDASNAFTQAAAPLAGTMHQALVGLDKDVTTLEPQLQGLFAAAEPDITVVTQGVDNFAKGVLPGLSNALSSSQGIVADFSNSLGPLGSGVGGFFTGLTRDAYTTGSGMESLLGTVGHLASTLGGVLGSAASVGSTALMGLDPVLNTTFSLIDKIANPATVGALGGVFAAMKLGGDTGALTKGLGSISTSLGGFAKDAETTEGAMGGLKSASGAVGKAFSSAADVVGGPWSMAIGAGIGLATGLAGAIINASHASDALTLSQQGLDQAVQQDNGHIGNAITSYVAAQAQADGLAASAANAHVSLETWTQAVIGNKDAQDAVTTSILTTNEVTQTAAAATDEAKTQTGKFSGELQDATTSVQENAAATNKLTDQNKQLINSMSAQNAQIVAAVQKQADYQAAMNTLTNSTNVFKASLQAQTQAQIASDQQSALSQVAALKLTDVNTLLSQKLYNVEVAYQQAAQGASGYASALQGLNGTADGLANAQQTVDQQLVQAATTFRQNGTAIGGMTQQAVANRGALNQAASAIQALGVAQEQASGSIDSANGVIQQQIAAYVKATGATGKARQAIVAYLEALAQIPPNVTTDITVNVDQVSVTALKDKLSQGKYATGGNVGAAATGGARGNLVQVGEQGPELVRMPWGSTVIPNANVQSMAATSSGGGGSMGQLEWVGGNAGDDFIRWLRSNIRYRGGNVQKVLGVN